MKTKILITAVNSPPGRSVYTSLKKNKNLDLICIDSDKNSVFSLMKKKKFFLSPPAKNKNYKKFINKIIRQNKIKIIIPCIEPEIIFFSKNLTSYKEINIFVPKLNVLYEVINKHKLFNLCKKLKIKTPKTQKISLPIKNKKLKIHYPIILKPIIGWGMNNVHVIKNKKQFLQITSDLRGEFIVQKFLGNFKKNIYAVGLLIDKNGKEKLNFISKSIITKYKNGGPAIAGLEVNNRFLLKVARKLISSLQGFCGPAMIEFIKTKGRNNFNLIDFNSRIWGYSQLADFNGKNFSQAIVDLALGNKIKIDKKNKKKFLMLRDFVDIKILKSKIT